MDGCELAGEDLKGVAKLTQLKALDVGPQLLLSSYRPILNLPALEDLVLSIKDTAIELFCLSPISTSLTKLSIRSIRFASSV